MIEIRADIYYPTVRLMSKCKRIFGDIFFYTVLVLSKLKK